MKLRTVASCAIAIASFVGCSLFVGLDGLSDDANVSDSGALASDGSPDAASFGDGASKTDSSFDSGPVDAGAWSFVSSDPMTSNSVPIIVTSGAELAVGDLVVVGCDTEKKGGPITLNGFPAASLPLAIVGPLDDGVAYEAQIAWGIVAQPFSTALEVHATPTNAVGFIDCTINVYRGGAASAAQVDSVKTTGPDDSGLVSCGPIKTAPGGLAYYIAARTSCAGIPLDPSFKQRTGINGNPNGDAVPTTGATLQTQLAACNNSTSAWICLMLSLSP